MQLEGKIIIVVVTVMSQGLLICSALSSLSGKTVLFQQLSALWGHSGRSEKCFAFFFVRTISY